MAIVKKATERPVRFVIKIKTSSLSHAWTAIGPIKTRLQCRANLFDHSKGR